jgi:hypothetical protein
MANTKRNTVAIEWPTTGHFTIEDLQKKYPSMVNITLRFRVKKALDNKEISQVGRIKPAIGRPRLVFVKGPATKEVVEAVLKTGVLPLIDKKEQTASVTVTEFSSEKKGEKKVVKTAKTVPATPAVPVVV